MRDTALIMRALALLLRNMQPGTMDAAELEGIRVILLKRADDLVKEERNAL